MESTTDYTFTPCVGSSTSPGIDTRQKGPTAYRVSSERHRQCGVNELAQVSKRRAATELPCLPRYHGRRSVGDREGHVPPPTFQLGGDHIGNVPPHFFA